MNEISYGTVGTEFRRTPQGIRVSLWDKTGRQQASEEARDDDRMDRVTGTEEMMKIMAVEDPQVADRNEVITIGVMVEVDGDSDQAETVGEMTEMTARMMTGHQDLFERDVVLLGGAGRTETMMKTEIAAAASSPST